ncbi:MAG: hypothetical protein K6F15_06125 [Treponema sp.]|nr:hypothetical protein [Treponema sp.]
MVKQDLIDKCPVRFFDEEARGGLKTGQLGLITAKKGLGKTSILVQFGLDSLLLDRHLVHVSFDQHSSNVIAWYDSILAEICKKKNIDSYEEFADSIIRDRTILNFNQEAFTLPKVVNTIKSLKEGGIKVSALVIDGVNLKNVPAEDVKVVAEFAKAENLVVWFSDTNDKEELSETVSAEQEVYFATVAHIVQGANGLCIKVLKADGSPIEGATVKLDTKTLLMSKKD